jgi:hypothetical protein
VAQFGHDIRISRDSMAFPEESRNKHHARVKINKDFTGASLALTSRNAADSRGHPGKAIW